MEAKEKRYLFVCGSCSICDTDTIKGPTQWVLNQIDAYYQANLKNYEPVMIEGAARGVDAIAKQYAENHGWQIIEMPAEWSRYGRAAGPIRNKKMVEACDECLVLWNGHSSGTKNDIELCKKLNKPYTVLIYNDSVKEEYTEKYSTL